VKIIKISSGSKDLSGLFLRQTPCKKGIWKDCQFIVNESVDECDWWVVCHNSGLLEIEQTICDPDHIVFISMEPNDSSKLISKKFLKQFSVLVGCDRSVKHKKVIYANGLTWWIGMNVKHQDGNHIFNADYSLDYDKLKIMVVPEKINRISVIVSTKNISAGHKKRLDFLTRLKNYPIGEYIDIYGGGFHPIPDKWDAISPYKYHLVLENGVVSDYWSEKLADAFLGFSYPIYYGCPNIMDYFDANSLMVINIDNIKAASEMMMRLIQSDVYDKYKDSVNETRMKVLDDYNIFNLITNICSDQTKIYSKCKLMPNSYFINPKIKQVVRNIIKSNKLIYSIFKMRNKQGV